MTATIPLEIDTKHDDENRDICICRADSTNRLNLRAGPGLAYDILGKISSSTLRVYGYSSAAPGWALVRYDPLYDVPQFGWVSTAYLISTE